MAKAFSCYKRSLNGFFLSELLVVVAIFLVLMTLSLGFWRPLHAYTAERVCARRFFHALNFVRTLALTRAKPFTYCGSGDGVHCDGQWALGQIVLDETGHVQHVFGPIAQGLSISYIANLNQVYQIVFTPEGFTRGEQGHFRICSTSIFRCVDLILHYSGEVIIHEFEVSLPPR